MSLSLPTSVCAGSSVASPSTTVQQSAWSKPLAASIFSQPAHAGSPAAFLGSRPSPSRIGPRAWPEQGSVTSQDVQVRPAPATSLRTSAKLEILLSRFNKVLETKQLQPGK